MRNYSYYTHMQEHEAQICVLHCGVVSFHRAPISLTQVSASLAGDQGTPSVSSCLARAGESGCTETRDDNILREG